MVEEAIQPITGIATYHQPSGLVLRLNGIVCGLIFMAVLLANPSMEYVASSSRFFSMMVVT